MKRKRYCYVLVAVGLALAMMTGCSTASMTDNTEIQPANTPTTQSADISAMETPTHTETPKLPTAYRITYEMENGDGTLSLITMAKDEEGNLYYQNGSEELWFLPQENGYIQALSDENGELVPISTGVILKMESVREKTAPFWACVEMSDKLIAPGFSHAGTSEIAGRTCDLYTNTMGIAVLNVTYQLYIDQETGICLGWTEEKETGIFDSEASEGTFLCSEFQTEDVVVPISE